MSPTGARGPFQLTASTAKQYGLSDPTNLDASMDAAGRLARDNAAVLKQGLGRDPTGAELYLAHQQGAEGALNILQHADAPAAGDAIAVNGGKPGMTNGQFAAMWAKRYGAGPGPSLPPVSADAAAVPGSMPGSLGGPGSFDVAAAPVSPSNAHLAAALLNPNSVATTTPQTLKSRAPLDQSADLNGPVVPPAPSPVTPPQFGGTGLYPVTTSPAAPGAPATPTMPPAGAPQAVPTAAGPNLPPVPPSVLAEALQSGGAGLPSSPVGIPDIASPQNAIRVPIGPASQPSLQMLANVLQGSVGGAPLSQVASAQAPQIARDAAAGAKASPQMIGHMLLNPGGAKSTATAATGTGAASSGAASALAARIFNSTLPAPVKAALVQRLMPTPVNINGRLVNPVTGQVVAHFSNPTIVAPGAAAIGSGGKVLFQNAPKKTTAEQDFEYGQTHPGFADRQITLKQAGRSQVNVNNAAEGAFGKEMGKKTSDDFISIQTAGQQAIPKLAAINQMRQMLGHVGYTSWGADTLLHVKQMARGIGIDIGNLGPAEAAQALGNQLALQLRNPSGGAGMPGALSDSDRRFLQASVPGLTKTPQGNALMLDYMQRLEQRNLDVANLANSYLRTHGGQLDVGFYGVLSQYSAEHPLFPQSANPQGGQFTRQQLEDEARRRGLVH